MSLTLSFGADSTNNFDIGSLADLSSTSLPTLLNLPASVVASLNQPLTAFPAAGSPIDLNYQSGNNCWTLGDFTFGLSGGVNCSISIVPPGSPLVMQPGNTPFAYTQSFPTTISGLDGAANPNNTANVPGPAVNYAVGIELSLTLAANAGATVPIGATGIQATASASTSDTYTVIFYKSVPGATTLKDALTLAFQGFVLPLHPMTFNNLQPGDYLYHNFNGTLNLGFGVTVGLDKVFVSGQSAASLPGTPASTPVVNASAQVGVNLGASFSFGFAYTGTFETLMWKLADGTGRLHLYRSKTIDPSFKIDLTAALVTNPTLNFNAQPVSDLIDKVLPGAATSTAQSAISTGVTDINNKIASWLTPLQSAQTELEITIDHLNSTYILLDYVCDPSQPAFPSAWQSVIKGDFQAAMQQPNSGFTLQPGSGLEQFHDDKTAICLNLFGKFNAAWTNASIADYSIVYAGNNTFNLVENIGIESITNINGSGSEIQLYFAAVATENAGAVTLSPPELHVQLKATKNPKFAARIAQLLTATGTVSSAAPLLTLIQTSAQNASACQTVELVFAPSAYAALTHSTIHGNNVVNEVADQTNYNQFALAAWTLEPDLGDVGSFSVNQKLDMTYGVWRNWNMVCIGRDPTSGTDFPDRTQSGAPQGNGKAWLDQRFNSPSTLTLIPYVLQIASGFMNLCEDVQELSTPALANVDGSWHDLCTHLASIIHNNVSADFLTPTAYALTELVLANGAAVAISGPTAGAANEPSITVTLRYA
jgi:hypothetical protein